MKVTIVSVTQPDALNFVHVYLSNHCTMKMTATCLRDLGWKAGDVISK